ncbi:tRNA pseudouridine synthase D [Phycisphaerales bacterium]|nr:tRNA pseudouridine synthase D [Phycisphaerales bacterium]
MTIRRVPEDFRVKEELTPEFLGGVAARSGRGETHAVFELEKRGLTTPDACAGLGRALGVRASAVERAGLKDMHAETTQWVSVEWKRADPPVERLEGKSWRAALRGWSARGIRAEDIARNRFEIVVRDLSAPSADEMGKRAGFLRAGADLEIVNYFGDQRFGSARHGEGLAGAHLVRGEFEQALRLLIATPARKESGRRRAISRPCASGWGEWKRLAVELPPSGERRAIEVLAGGGSFRDAFAALPYLTQSMAVEAFQSFLWNRAACEVVREVAGAERVLVAEDPFGEMLFPGPARVSAELRGMMAVLPSAESRPAGGWGVAMERVMVREGLTFEGLRVPGLRRPAFGAAERPLVVAAAGFELSATERDEMVQPRNRFKRTAVFSLPRGAYATVVLRALGQ